MAQWIERLQPDREQTLEFISLAKSVLEALNVWAKAKDYDLGSCVTTHYVEVAIVKDKIVEKNGVKKETCKQDPFPLEITHPGPGVDYIVLQIENAFSRSCLLTFPAGHIVPPAGAKIEPDGDVTMCIPSGDTASVTLEDTTWNPPPPPDTKRWVPLFTVDCANGSGGSPNVVIKPPPGGSDPL